MPLTVRADVVDIRTDHPQPADRLLTDTNVWLWMGYSNMGSVPQRAYPYQLRDYPNYISAGRKVGAKFFRCTLSLLELAHLIEGFERSLYEIGNPSLRPAGWTKPYGWMKTKDYRHSAERANVTTEIELAWGVVSGLSDALPLTLDDAMSQKAIQGLKTAEVDGYDVLIAETAKANDITQILTDDSDYATVPGVTVFTASVLTIAEARNQGKLVVR